MCLVGDDGRVAGAIWMAGKTKDRMENVVFCWCWCVSKGSIGCLRLTVVCEPRRSSLHTWAMHSGSRWACRISLEWGCLGIFLVHSLLARSAGIVYTKGIFR